MRSREETLEQFLERMGKEGKEADYCKRIAPYSLCAAQMKDWLEQYFRFLPDFGPEIDHDLFQSAPREFRISSITKTFTSIYEKVYDGEYPEKVIFDKLPDLARGRVVCAYLSQIVKIREHLINKYLVKLKGCQRITNQERDYIEASKADGYRAFHELLLVPISMVGIGTMQVRYELQLRTDLQDTWANRAHPLCYKNRVFRALALTDDTPAKRCIRDMSHRLHEVDRTFDAVRLEILRAIGDHQSPTCT